MALDDLPVQPSDAAIAQNLSAQVKTVLNGADKLIIGLAATRNFVLHARFMRSLRPDRYKSDDAALPSVIALLSQHLLSNAIWNMTTDSYTPPGSSNVVNETVKSDHIQWQVYGTGPRLRWEWAVTVVLIVTLTVQVFGLFQALYYRIAPGPWLTLGGMLVFANATSVMDTISNAPYCDDGESKPLASHLDGARYCLRHDGHGVARLSDEYEDDPDDG